MILYQKENSIHQEHIQIDLYRDFHFVPHLHRDLEFALLLEGEMEAIVQGRVEAMKPGDVALILPNEVHAYRTERHSRVLVCVFSGGYVHGFMREAEGKRGSRSVVSCDEALKNYLKSRYLAASPPDPLHLKATLYAVCAHYFSQVPLQEIGPGHGELLHRLLQYVTENYRENISMKKAAHFIGYDANYLSRYFHRMVGMNFRQFINQYRIEYACQLLQDKAVPITEAALKSGFQNIRSFNRAFLEIMGRTPTEYRQ